MRHRLALGSALGLILPALLAAPIAAAEPVGGYIILLRGTPAIAAAIADAHQRAIQAQVDHVYQHAVSGYSARLTPSQVERLWRDPRVAAISRDQVVSLSTPAPEQATALADTLPTGVDRVDGELSSAASGDGAGAVDADVAILDSGIDRNHPDLNVVGGVDCTGAGGYDDENGHGTHVAGIVGARDNGSGVVGVAPGVRLHAVRVLDQYGNGKFSNIICGVDWVTARASTIDVANISLGSPGREPGRSGCSTGNAMHDAICRSVAAGVTYTVAAGNDGLNAAGFVPASFQEVITVAALADFDGKPGGAAAPTCRTDVDDTLADFSNFGGDVDLIAPGACIASTWRGGRYETNSGTSMASPHVAGAAALVSAANPGASPATVRDALLGAASGDWDDDGDPDGIKEPLVNVGGL